MRVGGRGGHIAARQMRLNCKCHAGGL